MTFDDAFDLIRGRISRQAIATGILMSRHECTSEAATTRLVGYAMRTGRALHEVADEVIAAHEAGRQN